MTYKIPGEIEADWSSDWLDAVEAAVAAARVVANVQRPGGAALKSLRGALAHLDEINATKPAPPAAQITAEKPEGR